MKIDYRWLAQAIAFVGCIYSFLQIWERSKQLFIGYSGRDVLIIATHALLFLFCFFVMALTSYLKQKLSGTLKNSIPFFEKLISKLGLVSTTPKSE